MAPVKRNTFILFRGENNPQFIYSASKSFDEVEKKHSKHLTQYKDDFSSKET